MKVNKVHIALLVAYHTALATCENRTTRSAFPIPQKAQEFEIFSGLGTWMRKTQTWNFAAVPHRPLPAGPARCCDALTIPVAQPRPQWIKLHSSFLKLNSFHLCLRLIKHLLTIN